MALVKRLIKGSPLTFQEGDDNLDYLYGIANSALTAATDASVVTLVFNDMEFTHTSGSRSYYAGVGTAFTASSFGALVSNGNLVLTPTASASYPQYATFKSETANYKITAYRIYSNMTGSDFPQYNYNPSGPNISYVSLGIAYKDGANSSTSGQPLQLNAFSLTAGSYDRADNTWQVVPTGSVLSNPPTEIRDSGTLFTTGSTVNLPLLLGPTTFSPVYYTFLMSIGAGFKSKKYKFRIELDCVKY